MADQTEQGEKVDKCEGCPIDGYCDGARCPYET